MKKGYEDCKFIGFHKGQSARDGSYTDRSDGFFRKALSPNCVERDRIYKKGKRNKKHFSKTLF